MTTQTVIEATEDSFQTDVIDRSRDVPVIVDFWASWCGPCRVLGPVLETVAEDYGDEIQLVKIDTETNQQIASRYGIRSIPAVKAFRDGELVDEFVGALPEQEVRAFFNRIRPSEADKLTLEGEEALRIGNLETARVHFESAAAADENHPGAALGLASVLIDSGELDRAEGLVGRASNTERAKQLFAQINLLRAAADQDRATLEHRISSNESDLEARYQLGALLLSVSEWEIGFEHLLEVMISDRKFADDGARKLILDGLELLGPSHPLTSEYRRRLTNLLF